MEITSSKEFRKLYRQVPRDEKVTEIVDAIGLTIVRNYYEKTEYFKDGKKMFIKLVLRDNFLVGGVDMVEGDEKRLYTIIHENKKYKKRFTNFFFGPEEKITLISRDDKILVKVRNKEISLDDFIGKLVENHLSDRLFWARKKSFLKRVFLKILFFLTDDKYDFIEYYHKLNQLQEDRINIQIEKDRELELREEPFFKYFKIYKNTLFSFCIISFFVLLILKIKKILPGEEISSSNPTLLLSFFISLFLLHYFSSFFHRKKQERKGFIYKIHNSLFGNKFKFRI